MTDIISRKESFEFFLLGQVANWEHERRDLALDFIAYLFQRNENYVFIQLQQFNEKLGKVTDDDFGRAFQGLLTQIYRQEAIKQLGIENAADKRFYNSLKYVLKKHPQWEKQKTVKLGMVVTGNHSHEAAADEHQVREALRASSYTDDQLSKLLKDGLTQLLDCQKLVVPIKVLCRQIHGSPVNDAGEEVSSSYELDPEKRFYRDELRTEVMQEVQIILQKYEREQKLTRQEVEGFRSAVALLINDVTTGHDGQPYFEYLTDAFSNSLTRDDYQQLYRTRFEYVAKTARSLLSAKGRNRYND